MIPGNSDDDDTFTLVMLAAGALGAVVAAATAMATSAWGATLAWLLDYRLVVPSSEDPLLPLPYAHGIGLDANRCLIAAAVIALLLYLIVSRIHRRWVMRRMLG